MIYNMTNGPSTLYSNLLRRNTNAELQNRLAQAEQELATGVQSDIYASLSASAMNFSCSMVMSASFHVARAQHPC